VYQHHERINGTGYPNKMKGSQIITEAKILAVCDLMDAMSAFRPYREGYIMDEVIEELKRESGKLYDAEIVNTALVLLMKHNNQRFWTSK
jgi:HD-GYP domain-containing protein (c-di-GMP phosphodiesterase class II)